MKDRKWKLLIFTCIVDHEYSDSIKYILIDIKVRRPSNILVLYLPNPRHTRIISVVDTS